jgi:hypothetical protein
MRKEDMPRGNRFGKFLKVSDVFLLAAAVGILFPAIAVAQLPASRPAAGRRALRGLAAGGLGDFGLRFVHRQNAGVSVLVRHVSAVLVLRAFAAWAGRFLPTWRRTAT